MFDHQFNHGDGHAWHMNRSTSHAPGRSVGRLIRKPARYLAKRDSNKVSAAPSCSGSRAARNGYKSSPVCPQQTRSHEIT
jgi:hypothetical protein